MKITDPVTLLRISFWIGAIVDGFVAVQMVLPDTWASFNGLAAHRSSQELGVALGIGAALMFGWTVLLLWADRKPVDRRGILLITAFPVVTGLFLNNLRGISDGLMTLEGMAPSLAFQIGASLLFIYSYLNAGKMGKESPQKAIAPVR